MINILKQLEDTRNELARLERELATKSCREVGHRWVFRGGANACCFEDCSCSVPVYECSVCKDCDYGVNREAEDIRAACEKEMLEAETGKYGRD